MTRWTDESSDACERCPVMALMWSTSVGRLFQTCRGPATLKALSPTVDRLDCGWMRRLVLAERRARRLSKSATWMNGPRYDGAQPRRTLYVSTATLNWMRCGMCSQCWLYTIGLHRTASDLNWATGPLNCPLHGSVSVRTPPRGSDRVRSTG